MKLKSHLETDWGRNKVVAQHQGSYRINAIAAAHPPAEFDFLFLSFIFLSRSKGLRSVASRQSAAGRVSCRTFARVSRRFRSNVPINANAIAMAVAVAYFDFFPASRSGSHSGFILIVCPDQQEPHHRAASRDRAKPAPRCC